jgi:hypothetical protein
MPNAAYTALITDQRIVTSAAFTASRTLTLPPAGGTCIGQTCPAGTLEFFDAAGTLTATNTLVISPATGDTINGSASSLTFTTPNVRVALFPVSGTNWLAYAFIGGVGINVGTTIADNACAGCVGELITASLTSATQLVTTTQTNVISVSLTPGDWDCRGWVEPIPNTTTSVTQFAVWTSSTGATFPTPGNGSFNPSLMAISTAAQTSPLWVLGTSPMRYSLSATTTVFLETVATFTASNLADIGTLACRRVR